MAAPLVPHPDGARLAAALDPLVDVGALLPLAAIIYRFCLQRYAHPDTLVSGAGALKAGGRWNAPGAFRAVYCASSLELGLREYTASAVSAGTDITRLLPLAAFAVRVDLARLLDLTSPDVLAALGVTADQLVADPWSAANREGRESLCQAIGRAAFMAGVEALRTPSRHASTPGDCNIVLLPGNLSHPEAQVIVVPEAPSW
jgi:RES domain-containing protein